MDDLKLPFSFVTPCCKMHAGGPNTGGVPNKRHLRHFISSRGRALAYTLEPVTSDFYGE